MDITPLLDLTDVPAAGLGVTEIRTLKRYDGSPFQSEHEEITYPEGHHRGSPVRFVCKCGSAQFIVYAPWTYETRIRCIACNNDKCVASG